MGWLADFQSNPKILGTINFLDCPGGQADGTPQFSEAISEAPKPKISLINGGAYSAGYWFANLDDSDYIRMDEWVQRIKHWTSMRLRNLWFFMHQNDERFIPEACIYLIHKLNAEIGTSIIPPKLID